MRIQNEVGGIARGVRIFLQALCAALASATTMDIAMPGNCSGRIFASVAFQTDSVASVDVRALGFSIGLQGITGHGEAHSG